MERVITKTLAEIYLEQGHLQEAYEIYKALSEKDPSNKEIQRKRRALEEQLQVGPSRQEGNPSTPRSRSDAKKLRILKQWLANIQKRKEPCPRSSPIEE
jgi:thioredoxin-like negative regulator of GroEL